MHEGTAEQPEVPAGDRPGRPGKLIRERGGKANIYRNYIKADCSG